MMHTLHDRDGECVKHSCVPGSSLVVPYLATSSRQRQRERYYRININIIIVVESRMKTERGRLYFSYGVSTISLIN